MAAPVRFLIPLLVVFAAACSSERPSSALALTLELPVAADCIRIEASVPGSRETSTVKPAAGEPPKRRYVVAVYAGGKLGAGDVALRATGHFGSCESDAFLAAKADARFPARGTADVTLSLAPVSEDGDGDGVPDKLDCAPTDARRFPQAGPERNGACGNGLDDDCDGLAEDGCPCSAPRACYPEAKRANAGVGACALGTQACTGGVYGTECSGAVLPADESCDEVDTDCDGQVDPPNCPCESGATRSCYEKGPPLDAGVGICTRGTQACLGGSWLACTGDVAPEPERCNGLDDDCDGQVDERPDVPTPLCALQEGVCAGASAACGATECGPTDYALAATGRGNGYVATEGLSACDGLDNDCDGEVDEGCPCTAGASEACHPLGLGFAGLDAGSCRAGARTCQADGGWGACLGSVSPSLELCNGQDDDCDGQVDDSPADAGTPCPAQGLGVCGVGTWACAQGALVCGGAPSASPERCNGQDDDCDGANDEDFAATLGSPCDAGIGACARVGSITCQPDGTAACNVVAGSPSAELCNGQDDDCDGVSDEAFSGLNTLCTVGTGGCLRGGTITCLPDGGSGCNAEVVPPSADICNGKDDDCDGASDEDFPDVNSPCSVGVGACQRAGSVVCLPDGGSGCNQVPGPPAAETCNNGDDDCNGLVDDNIPGVGSTACSVGAGLCRRTGVLTCTAGVSGCSVSPGPAAREVCNGLDDDCDGFVDERPECGGPSGDFAENAASTWTTADLLTVPQPFPLCSTTERNHSTVETSPQFILAGASTARFNYGTAGSTNGNAVFTGVYPAARNGAWDLTTSAYSTIQGITFAAGYNVPSGVSWARALPVVVLCSPAGYRLYAPVSQSMGNQYWIRSFVPIGGNAAWSVTDGGTFDLSHVSFVEFYFQPLRNNVAGQIVVWLDDVKFY